MDRENSALDFDLFVADHWANIHNDAKLRRVCGPGSWCFELSHMITVTKVLIHPESVIHVCPGFYGTASSKTKMLT